MTYKELQKKAKELGLPYVGVSRSELLKSVGTSKVEEVKPENPKSNPTPPEQPKENKLEEVKSKMNTAVIMDGNHEVRRYSLDVHGEKFADLALSFISDRKYTVKFIDVQASHICEACGHRTFNK